MIPSGAGGGKRGGENWGKKIRKEKRRMGLTYRLKSNEMKRGTLVWQKMGKEKRDDDSTHTHQGQNEITCGQWKTNQDTNWMKSISRRHRPKLFGVCLFDFHCVIPSPLFSRCIHRLSQVEVTNDPQKLNEIDIKPLIDFIDQPHTHTHTHAPSWSIVWQNQ